MRGWWGNMHWIVIKQQSNTPLWTYLAAIRTNLWGLQTYHSLVRYMSPHTSYILYIRAHIIRRWHPPEFLTNQVSRTSGEGRRPRYHLIAAGNIPWSYALHMHWIVIKQQSNTPMWTYLEAIRTNLWGLQTDHSLYPATCVLIRPTYSTFVTHIITKIRVKVSL